MSSITCDLPVPDLMDVLDAQRLIRPYLPATPLHNYSGLDAVLGARALIKHENYQPVGAFKVRGGINLIARLTPEEKAKGVIGASTGNHGQSIAYASRLFGVPARIVAPQGANPGKVAAMEGMGAQVIFHGENYDQARLHCEDLARKNGYRYIHSGDEPLLIAGVATETLEMLEVEPRLEIIFVPVGGGSGAAGACIAAKAVNPNIKVIGVQAQNAPAAHESWRKGELVEIPAATMAEGLATGTAFALPQMIMAKMLDDFILVSEDEIKQAMIWMIDKCHTLAEASAAAALAGAYKLKQEIQGRIIGVICSGGNTSIEHLKMALEQVL